MTKPVTAVAAMQLYEEGRSPSRTRWRGSSPPSPSCASTATARLGPADRARRDPADAAVAPAHPHRRPDLRVPPCPPGRRHVPGGRVRVGGPRRPRPGRVLRPLGRAAAAVRAGHRVELLGGQRRPRPGGRGGQRPAPGPVPSPSASSGRWACRHRLLGRGRPTPAPGRPVQAGPAGRPVRNDELGGRALRRPAAWPAVAGWSRPPPTTTASPRRCCAGASSTGPACSAAAPWPTWPATTCPAGPTSSRSAGGCSPRPPSTGSASASGSRSCSTRWPTRSSPRPASSPGAAPPAPSSGSTRPSGSPPSSSPS